MPHVGTAPIEDPSAANLPELHGSSKGRRLEDVLERFIGDAEPGQRLPSERELAARYGLARMTVRGAVSNLVARGLATRVQGQGTFVAERRIVQPATITSFTEDMAARGLTASSIVLSQEVVPASPWVAGHLELRPGEPVVRIERIRSGDGVPMALERAHVPETLAPDLAVRDLTAASLYGLLATEHGIVVATSDQRISAVMPTEAEAHLLHTDTRTPALRIERVARSGDGAVVEFVRALYRGDRYELQMTQNMPPPSVAASGQ